jgi:hypothetical protein
MLADHLNDDAEALALCEAFMQQVVANFDNTWEMSGADIDTVLSEPRRT